VHLLNKSGNELGLNTVTSHFTPTSTRPTNSPQVGHHPTSLPTLPYRNFCSGQLLLIQLSLVLIDSRQNFGW